MNLFAFFKICCLALLFPQVTSKVQPWTRYCQETAYCYLVKGDVAKENGGNSTTDYREAERVSTIYLEKEYDYDKLEEVLEEEGIQESGENVVDLKGKNITKLNDKLKPLGVKLVNASSLQKAPHENSQALVTFDYDQECLNLLEKCKQELNVKLRIPEELKLNCPWQSIPYNMFHCKTIQNWPATVKSNLEPFQKTCHQMIDCHSFEKWETFRNTSLPDDWEKRKLERTETEESGPENRRLGRRYDLTVRAPTTPAPRNELLGIISSKPENAVTITHTKPPKTLSNWLSCRMGEHSVNAFRIYDTVHGVAGISINCLENHNKSYSAGQLVTNLTEFIQRPLLQCENNSIITGFNLLYLKTGTWKQYIDNIEGICTDASDYVIPEGQQSNNSIIKTVKCKRAEAVCGIRISLQKPIFRNYERMYDLQIYCCNLTVNCADARLETTNIFHEYDNDKDQLIAFDEPVGFKKIDNASIDYVPEVVSKKLKTIYNGLVKPKNWKKPPATELFGHLTLQKQRVQLNGTYLYVFTKQTMTCGNIIYYFNTSYEIVQKVSASRCKPRIIDEYVKNFTFYTSWVDNVPVGVESEVKSNQSDTDFNKTLIALDENFKRHKVNLSSSYFQPIKYQRVLLPQIANFVTQKVGICQTKGDSFKVYTDQITKVNQPDHYCSSGQDTFEYVGAFQNFDEPAGLDILYELKIGLDWPGKPTYFKYPPGTTNNYLALFNVNIGEPSQYTGVKGWSNTKRANYLTGIYKKTHKIHIPFMWKIKIYQVVGTCAEWKFYTGFKFYRVYDYNGKCLGGFADDQNSFDCERKIDGLEYTNYWMHFMSVWVPK